jgi:multicomponent Na+:H+ antiporter subunit G
MFETLLPYLDSTRLVLGYSALALGSLAILTGALGLVRLGDVYQRMHGAGIVDTGGAGLVLFGLLMISPEWQVSVRLVLIGALLILTSPTATHAIARAARVSDMAPDLAAPEKDDEAAS